MEYVQKTTPYKHQQLILENTWKKSWWGLLLEMGTGKSKIIIDNMLALHEEGLIDRALILAPKGNYDNWVDKEIPVHAPDRSRALMNVHLWEGGHTVRERASLARIMAPGQKLSVLVLNIEAVSSSSTARRFAEQFLRGGPAMLCVDESSTIKNPSAERTKTLLKWGRIARYRRIATGTPMTRSPMDLWSQFEFLSPGSLGQRSYYGFRARYAVIKKMRVGGQRVPGTDRVIGGREIEKEVGYRNLDELRRRVQEHATILKKDDCLDLPPKIFLTRHVELTPEQRRHYDELVSDALTLLSGGAMVTYQHKIVLMIRLQQIVAGHIVDDMGQLTMLPQNRTAALREILEESSGKTIIWCNFRPDVELVSQLLREMGRTFVVYGEGEMSRTEAVQAFQEQEDPEIFLSTSHRGGYGITLTRASNVVYFTNNYDLEKRLQTEDRAHRIGQTRAVTYTDITAPGTIDDSIVASLIRKQDTARQVTDNSDFARMLRGLLPVAEGRPVTTDQSSMARSLWDSMFEQDPLPQTPSQSQPLLDLDPPPSFMLGDL